MLPILTVVGLSAGSFVSTSFDNFTLLLGFYADDRYARGRVLLGYLASTAGMVLLAHALASTVEAAPSSLLGYLGVIPLALGLVRLYALLRPGRGAEPVSAEGPSGFLAVLGVMLANSGDTLAVFISVFADTADGLESWIVGTAVGLAFLYATLAGWLVRRSGAAERLHRYSRWALPFLLIGIGAYILADTATDVVP